MRDWRNTQTNLTSLNLFQWIYSINFIQFKWINCPETGFFSPVLHVLVLDGLAGGDAVRYVEVDELSGQLNHSRQSVHNLENVKKEWLRTVDYLHTVQWHLHVDQHRKILCYAGRAILWWMNMLSSDFFQDTTCMRMRSISMAIIGLFSTKSGNLAGVRPRPETTWGSRSSSVKSRCCSPSVSVLCNLGVFRKERGI